MGSYEFHSTTFTIKTAEGQQAAKDNICSFKMPYLTNGERAAIAWHSKQTCDRLMKERELIYKSVDNSAVISGLTIVGAVAIALIGLFLLALKDTPILLILAGVLLAIGILSKIFLSKADKKLLENNYYKHAYYAKMHELATRW